MYALKEAYPNIISIRRELTFLIGIFMLLMVVGNFTTIFGNTHVLHTSNKSLWMYDLFAILFWTINVCTWSATYWDYIEDSQIIHLMFFLTPIVLLMWGTILIFNVKEIVSVGIWHLFLLSYIFSITISTLFCAFIAQEIKKIKNDESNGVVTEDNGLIGQGYRLMTTSGELPSLNSKQKHTSKPFGNSKPENGYNRLPEGTDNIYF